MHIHRLAITAGDMVWTIYDNWRSSNEVQTPRLFHCEDIDSAIGEAERAKKYAKVETEYKVDPKYVRVVTVTLSTQCI